MDAMTVPRRNCSMFWNGHKKLRGPLLELSMVGQTRNKQMIFVPFDRFCSWKQIIFLDSTKQDHNTGFQFSSVYKIFNVIPYINRHITENNLQSLYRLNYWHTSGDKGTSAFTSNTLLIRIKNTLLV